VHRILKSSGTFWLAIGDEYAAELKLASQEIGFQCRSWVIWYYTFGVNCKYKFSRSHAHLFYFVKDAKQFTFRADEPENRIPSARQLVYADARANPAGRLPDDTWVLPRKIWPIASPRPKTPGTSRASRERSKSGPASTAAKCPSSFWAASSASARTPATSCSTPLAEARRHWPSPKNSAVNTWASICRKTT